MCVDYTDLNKNCPKDTFPFLELTMNLYELLTFMDVFSKYNKIKMTWEDKENTLFMIDKGLSSLKWPSKCSTIMETYINDMLVKSYTVDTHLTDLGETFGAIKRFQI